MSHATGASRRSGERGRVWGVRRGEAPRLNMKQKTVFACQECGAQSSKWMGRCAECGAWNSILEERPVPEAVIAGAVEKRYSLAVAAGPQLYADISIVNAQRLTTGIGEFDRVLGGGVVPDRWS